MKAESIRFPVYRKYKNNKSYFKILSLAAFEEVQVIGNTRKFLFTEAKQYPEKLFINDLLFHYDQMAVDISEDEYQAEFQRTS